VRTDRGDEITCRYYVMATGCLSMPKVPDIVGTERFGGDVYYTSSWPHDGVDFSGRRVGVIGTGSSAVQSIPIIAEQAGQLTVFQRTPNFSIPARNGPVAPERVAAVQNAPAQYRHEARWSPAGVPREVLEVGAMQVSEAERLSRYEQIWEDGELLGIGGAFADIITNADSNETLCEFIRGKIREIVDDPATAEALCPTDHPVGSKRPCLDTNYYATYNRPNVRLVDLRTSPILTITETGVETADDHFEFDAIVYATGFDAMTGAIVAVDIRGRDGLTLAEKWADGPKTYLGLMSVGFPNFFAITGPGSPSVLSNMSVSIEQHVEWIGDCLTDLRDRAMPMIEPTERAETGWGVHVDDCANITLFPKANSWYMGANVPGKPRVFFPYVGGVDKYRAACDEVIARDYLGFRLTGADRSSTSDGVIRRVQPDVAIVLELMESLGLPPMESMSPDDARQFMAASSAERPPGPDVGEVVDGTLPGAEGDLDYRLYRPASPGPHPIVVYFHGGGWVLGNVDSDDPLCRDLCDRSDAIIVSVDYRHAPEHRFPAAPLDGFAAVEWIAAHAIDLGGVPGELAVAGWSAGANIATVVCQMARDAGGPAISGQLLLTPVTDCDMTTQSYVDNAEGFILTKGLMEWFWNHYADEADRVDPKASPRRAADLSDLPPAMIVTADFDPLRDEGTAYAEALSAAGNKVHHERARGHTHTSIGMVDIIISAVPIRAKMAAALRQFFVASVPA
jgi:acetyl esterase/lipase/cation diffusion facilitator CzcD-associated flavoprotein CzcO